MPTYSASYEQPSDYIPSVVANINTAIKQHVPEFGIQLPQNGHSIVGDHLRYQHELLPLLHGIYVMAMDVMDSAKGDLNIAANAISLMHGAGGTYMHELSVSRVKIEDGHVGIEFENAKSGLIHYISIQEEEGPERADPDEEEDADVEDQDDQDDAKYYYGQLITQYNDTDVTQSVLSSFPMYILDDQTTSRDTLVIDDRIPFEIHIFSQVGSQENGYRQMRVGGIYFYSGDFTLDEFYTAEMLLAEVEGESAVIEVQRDRKERKYKSFNVSFVDSDRLPIEEYKLYPAKDNTYIIGVSHDENGMPVKHEEWVLPKQVITSADSIPALASMCMNIPENPDAVRYWISKFIDDDQVMARGDVILEDTGQLEDEVEVLFNHRTRDLQITIIDIDHEEEDSDQAPTVSNLQLIDFADDGKILAKFEYGDKSRFWLLIFDENNFIVQILEKDPLAL
jgi:hypothetical protein